MHKKKLVRTALFLLSAGVLYFLWVKVTGLAIPCLFRAVTGFKCPGCGITTLIMDLAALDFRGAYEANPFLFVTGPFLAADLLYCAVRKYQGKKPSRPNQYLLAAYTAALCLFGVIRNLS